MPLLAALGFLALTTVLSVNYNAERLYRAERGGDAAAMPETTGRADGLLRRPLRRAVRAAGPARGALLRTGGSAGAGPQARLAYHDRATVSILANLGMSTQLAVFGLCIALGRPLAFAWIALAELGLVALLALRRELLIRTIPHLKEETP